MNDDHAHDPRGSRAPDEARTDADTPRAPVSGTCPACGCPLGYRANLDDGVWFCCGGCADSRRCRCGCEPDLVRSLSTDAYVPTRRMFASRRPDELQGTGETRQRHRAFPFADPRRGR